MILKFYRSAVKFTTTFHSFHLNLRKCFLFNCLGNIKLLLINNFVYIEKGSISEVHATTTHDRLDCTASCDLLFSLSRIWENFSYARPLYWNNAKGILKIREKYRNTLVNLQTNKQIIKPVTYLKLCYLYTNKRVFINSC